MVFNEILIPQDPFTETNVTRKRSVVGDSHLSKKIFVSYMYVFKKTKIRPLILLGFFLINPSCIVKIKRAHTFTLGQKEKQADG